MRVHLADNFYLRSDRYCYFLVEEQVSKKDPETAYDRPMSYWGTLDGVIKGMADIKVKRLQATTIQELRKDLEAIIEEVREIRKGLAPLLQD